MKKILYIFMLSVILVSCWKENVVEETTLNTDIESNISDEESMWVAESEWGNSQFSIDSGLNFNQ